jgi:hypothetical protein
VSEIKKPPLRWLFVLVALLHCSDLAEMICQILVVYFAVGPFWAGVRDCGANWWVLFL